LRVALGAQPHELAWQVIREGAGMAAAGTVIGAVVTLIGAQGLSGLVYGVQVADPFSFALAGACVLLVAASASFIPARRALQIRPMAVLRSE
jgi:ABC-type antimicrobial peptide transport system permease subunit